MTIRAGRRHPGEEKSPGRGKGKPAYVLAGPEGRILALSNSPSEDGSQKEGALAGAHSELLGHLLLVKANGAGQEAFLPLKGLDSVVHSCVDVRTHTSTAA